MPQQSNMFDGHELVLKTQCYISKNAFEADSAFTKLKTQIKKISTSPNKNKNQKGAADFR